MRCKAGHGLQCLDLRCGGAKNGNWGLLPLRLLCCVPLSGEHSPSSLKAGVRVLKTTHAPRDAAAFRCCARLRGGRTALAVGMGRQMSLAAMRRGAPLGSERPRHLPFLDPPPGTELQPVFSTLRHDLLGRRGGSDNPLVATVGLL
ncbi:hypothetical protein NDU88_007405 [Pleurodeles waltl]|uniref:Uncharacterized protein n=1 Tax=Pleurodeles waltl TaxID=8319 RepID=A0AAV7RQ25_PLEWA|nr:hypothetical protein NDU88_007405 [Pleurodeles waltl]